MNRELQIIEHMPLVLKLVRYMRMRLPDHIDRDDLEQEGMLGLIDAVDKFDESRGVPLERYVALRVKGAIVDYLRREDPLSRDHRESVRTGESPRVLSGRARTEYTSVDDRSATIERVTADLELDRAEATYHTAAECQARAEAESMVRIGSRFLTSGQREAFHCTMIDGMDMRSTARRMGITQGRVSQLCAAAVEKIRDRVLR